MYKDSHIDYLRSQCIKHITDGCRPRGRPQEEDLGRGRTAPVLDPNEILMSAKAIRD